MIFNLGGPGHLDTWDMKPDAPREIRGPFRPIRTRVPGLQISELFPLQAKIADRFSIVRSLHHNRAGHFDAGHWMLTGRGGVNGANNAGKYPSIGSIATKVLGSRKSGMPAYVGVPCQTRVVGSERPPGQQCQPVTRRFHCHEIVDASRRSALVPHESRLHLMMSVVEIGIGELE